MSKKKTGSNNSHSNGNKNSNDINDVTQVRQSKPTADSAGPDVSVKGSKAKGLKAEGSKSRSSEPADGPSAASDATVVRRREPAGAGKNAVLKNKNSSASTQEPTQQGINVGNDTTIIRQPVDSSDKGAVTQDKSTTSVTSGASVTKVSDSSADIPDSQDATVINTETDSDATRIGGGQEVGSDTTYIAAIGNIPGTSKGNSEAGRLLKNRFVLEEKVGSGGMGDVYKALDLRQKEAKERNPYIAVKLLNEQFSRHKDAFISLQREATRTRGIPHPNIMGVYDFDKEGDTVFMTMELLDGKPLDDYLKEHPEGVSREDAVTIINDICMGLGRAHDANIVHSDFKPGNIYWCADKRAKVFDFGIARAVSNPGELEADGEKTVFDAGSLGALTPTYASYEMLGGMEPTKSDDIYAVALVAYELFTGKHPYGRVSADKAFEQKLVPEPVPGMKRRHWKALRKALEFKGEDRTQSLDEFRLDLFSEDPPYFRYAAIAAILIASVGFGIYQQLKEVEVAPDEFVEAQGRFEAYQRNIDDRLGDNIRLSQDNWHSEVKVNLERLSVMRGRLEKEWPQWLEEGWVEDAEQDVEKYQLGVMNGYLGQIRVLRETAEIPIEANKIETDVNDAIEVLKQAQKYLGIVKKNYSYDASKINDEAGELAGVLKVGNILSSIFERDRLNAIAAAEAEERRIENEIAIANEKAEQAKDYNSYIATFEDVLRCKGDISEADLTGRLRVALEDLERRDSRRFAQDKPGIVAALVGCIQQRVAVRKPDRARYLRDIVKTYLPGEPAISNIRVIDLDPCDARGLEAQGIRNRSWCVDKLSIGGTGPQLVVIPPQPGKASGETLGNKFATSRMEIRVSDYNDFCEDTGCAVMSGSASIPVTNVTLQQARDYTVWLSDQTGKTYRLPTSEEWMYVAETASNEAVDENVNCAVDSRGVKLGEKLLNTLSGRPNSWGIYNHVGNAREWAISGEEVFAHGGAHTDPRSECTLGKKVAHNGEADPVTGFRVVRLI
ncbi:MAG: protein kinase [Pseudomonadales bacterium]|nr:protein kinase [Pseudomonadales bacterium]